MIEDIGTKHPDFEYAYKLNTMNGKTTIIISEHGGVVYVSATGKRLQLKAIPTPTGILLQFQKNKDKIRVADVLNRFWRKVWKR